MTPSSRNPANCHDTLSGMTGKGTARQTVRVEEALWQKFGDAATAAGTDRSAVLREYMRWYSGDPDAISPSRPAGLDTSGSVDPDPPEDDHELTAEQFEDAP